MDPGVSMRSKSSRKGQSLLEYTLLVVMVGLMGISATMHTGEKVGATIQNVPDALANASQ